MLQVTNQGILIRVKVIPKASRSELVGWEGDELKIRIAAVPDKGAANAELIHHLSKLLETAKSNIQLMSGDTSRRKLIRVGGGLTLDQVESMLAKNVAKNSARSKETKEI